VPDSERYTKTSAMGHEFLIEVVSADYKLSETPATLHIADLGDPKKAAAGLQKLNEFEASAGEKISDIPGLGEDAFAVSDPYYGELAAAWQGRLVYIAVGEEADRSALGELLREAMTRRSTPAGKFCPAG
jgi:hypothetical protein